MDSRNWELIDPEKWVQDGYVCVRVDSQGHATKGDVTAAGENCGKHLIQQKGGIPSKDKSSTS